MLRVALTGGIGSGKSTITSYFENLWEIPIINSDRIAYEITKPGKKVVKKIISYFGKEVLLSDTNSLDRTRLRELIFKNSKDRQWIENLLHPIIITEMKNRLKHIKAPYCILEIPLLAETWKSIDFIDRILVVDSPEILQIKRIKFRDLLSYQQIQSILHSQSSRKKRLAIADDVIVNNRPIALLRKIILTLHYRYLKLTK